MKKSKRKSKSMLDNVTVVIRSVGERTEKACYNAILKQVIKENIFIVNEQPFSEAVRRNFEIGVKQNLRWTLSVDADLILSNNAIKEMVDAFSKLENSYFIYQGWVYDKFFKDFRTGGPHLYRTSLLEKAIEFIPKEGTSLRPESSTYIAMKELGHGYFVDNKYYGLHDFEQNKQDIYRKFFLHAKKHRKLLGKFLDSWKEDILKDEDYIFALKGLSDGLLYKGKIFIDVDFFKQKSNHFFSELSIKEKDSFLNEDVLKEYFYMVENQLTKAKNKLKIDDNNKNENNKEVSFLMKMKNKVIKTIHKK
ncbi:hypothetical protein [Flavivirga spongiicola]|uniref:Glycosyltransferase 2-like domain-containing protein n=1 Tax=Flavivirga spongiicola TaxID=421621 RepID=A0ABU7XMK5_9FLAO|nr:hypothetical protein [Flavivirga sp. MEBiC05379]MDO5981659.1 hypothetical protein [Flavivirga sp. MEBiC05379]